VLESDKYSDSSSDGLQTERAFQLCGTLEEKDCGLLVYVNLKNENITLGMGLWCGSVFVSGWR
jgi:hypothetical protein